MTSFKTFWEACVVTYEFIPDMGCKARLADDYACPDKDDLPEEGIFAVYRKTWLVGESFLHLFLETSGLVILCLEFDFINRGWKFCVSFKFWSIKSEESEFVCLVRPRSF